MAKELPDKITFPRSITNRQLRLTTKKDARRRLMVSSDKKNIQVKSTRVQVENSQERIDNSKIGISCGTHGD